MGEKIKHSMKPVQDLSNEELLAEINTYNPWHIAGKGSRRFELGKELARRLKEKTITIE